MRVEYGNHPFLEENLPEDPIALFEKWFREAVKAEVMEPNGMTLATVSPSGRPASRVVLLKAFSHDGFCFYTGKKSRKGEQLAKTPYASLTFWWKEIYRQVHLEGKVVPLSRQEVLAYFQKRPKGAKIAAAASYQSEPLASRAELEESYSRLKKAYRGKEVPCPKGWGGYRLSPSRIEFWQGRKNRLHDRFVYIHTDDHWLLTRLSP